MKIIKFFPVLTAAIAIVAVVSFGACKKPDNSQAIATPLGHLYFHLHTNIGSMEADSGNVFPDANGRKFLLTYAQFFISGITIYNYTTNTPYTLPVNDLVLKYIDNEDYYVADVPAGNYGSVSYNIGLSPAENSTPPNVLYSQMNPGNGLPPATAPMYWNAAQGYVFLNVQGLADTTAAHNGPVNFPFSYQVGTNSMLEHIQLPRQQFTIIPGQISFVHQVCDYGNLLQGIKFVHTATPFNADSATARMVANRVSNNFIQYEMQTIQP